MSCGGLKFLLLHMQYRYFDCRIIETTKIARAFRTILMRCIPTSSTGIPNLSFLSYLYSVPIRRFFHLRDLSPWRSDKLPFSFDFFFLHILQHFRENKKFGNGLIRVFFCGQKYFFEKFSERMGWYYWQNSVFCKFLSGKRVTYSPRFSSCVFIVTANLHFLSEKRMGGRGSIGMGWRIC